MAADWADSAPAATVVREGSAAPWATPKTAAAVRIKLKSFIFRLGRGLSMKRRWSSKGKLLESADVEGKTKEKKR